MSNKSNKTTEQKLADSMPREPDPFWPEGVAPSHLSVADQKDPQIAELYAVKGDIWHCSKCGTTMRRSKDDPALCAPCYAEAQQSGALAQKVNANWMEEAAALGLSIFERQPAETNVEWLIWDTYRGHYPMKLPTYGELASECDCSVATVIKTAQKWNFKSRMVEWARYTDAGMQEQRIKDIKEMNDRQVSMAKTIQSKLAAAIEIIDPTMLRPGEIVNLFKVSTELERRIAAYVPEQIDQSVAVDKSAKQAGMTKVEDISEILGILQNAGAMPKTMGVETTTTTRVIMNNGGDDL